MKNRENASGKTRKNYFLGDNRKFENQKKTLGKIILAKFHEKQFFRKLSENCRQILAEFLETFRFCLIINYLLDCLYCTVK